MFQKVRFIGTIAALYITTVGVIGYALYPSLLIGTPVHADIKRSQQKPHKPVTPRFVLVSGKPIRITIPDYAIDLAVDEGYYNAVDGSWSLSQTHAQFAMMTTLANNAGGNTFIYGHGTDGVFGKIGTTPPPVGTIAEIYTDTNHVFSYRLQEVKNLSPTDTTLLDDTTSGPPRLTIQTCTGSFSEWRTMFTFTFEKVS